MLQNQISMAASPVYTMRCDKLVAMLPRAKKALRGQSLPKRLLVSTSAEAAVPAFRRNLLGLRAQMIRQSRHASAMLLKEASEV